jgi:hypothetical protein
MNTYDVKNSYSSQATTVNRGREEFVNSIQIDWSWYTPIFYSQSLFKFLPWRQVLKKLPCKLHFREFEEMQMLHIQSSNRKMASFDQGYYDRARLPATQRRNKE